MSKPHAAWCVTCDCGALEGPGAGPPKALSPDAAFLRQRRHVAEVKVIPHSGKCACGAPAELVRLANTPDGSVVQVLAARAWCGALYPACAAHKEAGCVVPSEIARTF